MKIGIIGAMESEIASIAAKISDRSETCVAGMTFYEGTLYGRSVVVARAGVGKVHAAMCAQVMIERFAPGMVLNIGVAGALSEALKIGDLVIADAAVQHDVDTTAFGDPLGMISGPNTVLLPCDKDAADALSRAAGEAGMPFVRAVIATGDQFIAELSKKRALAAQFSAAACDMEGGAIAQVCMENKTPYAAYRAISDTLLGNGEEYTANLFVAAEHSARILKAYLEK